MRREISFRYRLLRGGAYCALLRAEEGSAPHVRMNDSGDIKSSFTGTFAPTAFDVDGEPVEIDWLSDEIQPVLVINGTEYPLGVFMPATPKIQNDGVQTLVQVEAYDRCWRARDTRSESLIFWPAGTLYLDAVEQLLTASGINAVIKTPSAAAFSTAREDWDIGTSYLQIINQLLDEISYKPLWFNVAGAAVLEPASMPEPDAIRHILDASDPETLVIPGIERETDIYSAPNVFICTCSNPDKPGLLAATAVNDNPQSPLSVQRRGRRICTTVSVDNIADLAALQLYANRLRDQSLITGETVTVSTALQPNWGVQDVAALRYGEVSGICLERGFEMELAVGGKMRHTLERVVYQIA